LTKILGVRDARRHFDSPELVETHARHWLAMARATTSSLRAGR
jgi:hypothetical protein